MEAVVMENDINRRFLQMLGWEGEELESFIPDWELAAKFLSLTDKDIQNAVENWIPKYWDISLLSVRKMIAACVRETAELAKMNRYKAEGKKILYVNNTSLFACVYANKLAGHGELHFAYPDFIMTTVWQAFCGKSEGQFPGKPALNPACGHCALNCTRATTNMDGHVPEPTATWNWGLHCNEAPKTEELIDCLCQRDEQADVLTAIPHDAPLGEIEAENEERVAFLAAQIREGQQRVSELTGITVTDQDLRDGIEAYMAYMRRVEKLTDLVVNADPQPISGIELALFSLNMQVCFDSGMDYVNDALDTAIAEVEDRIRRGVGNLPKGAPRLACHFAPLNVPWVDRAFRDNGVNLSLGRVFPLASWMEEAIKHDDDPYIAAARMCLMWPDAVNMKNEAEIVVKLFEHYSFDGALFGFYDFDRWIGALQKTMIRIVEERTGIPHYYLEGEFWDGCRYNIDNRISIIRSICSCLKISNL